MLGQPVSPVVIAGATNVPAPGATGGSAEPLLATISPTPAEQTLQLSPLQGRIAATTLRDDQSRVSLLQMADDATQSLTTILNQMKDLVAQIGDASLDEATRSLAQQQFNSLAHQLNAIAHHAAHAAGGEGDATKLGNAIATMADALIAVTSSSNTSAPGIPPNSSDAPLGGDAVYITALSEALDSVSVVRVMILAAAQSLSHPEFNAANMNLETGPGDVSRSIDYLSQGVNMGIDQALMQAGGGVLKDAPTISALVTFLLQSSTT